MWLARLFIKNPEDTGSLVVREQYAQVAGITGILVNLLLSLAKFLVGSLSGSVAITADAANNLSDAGSSLISILGFRLASRPADKEHPFGHARYEYIASTVVAVIIFILAFQLAVSSIERIADPQILPFNPWAGVILVMSILMKLWLYRLNRSIGRTIDSSVLKATAVDALSDAVASLAVLIASILSPLIHFSLDGYMGLLVALFIAWVGVQVIRESFSLILGETPDPSLVKLVLEHVKGAEGVLGVHDLVLHSYGPGRHFATVHVEVDAGGDFLKSHDIIDNIEREVAVDHGIQLVIHMDPIITDDEKLNERRQQVQQLLAQIDPNLSMHDFRMVEGPTHTNLIFDVVVPIEYPTKDKALLATIIQGVQSLNKDFYAVVTIDRTYTATPSNKVH